MKKNNVLRRYVLRSGILGIYTYIINRLSFVIYKIIEAMTYSKLNLFYNGINCFVVVLRKADNINETLLVPYEQNLIF